MSVLSYLSGGSYLKGWLWLKWVCPNYICIVLDGLDRDTFILNHKMLTKKKLKANFNNTKLPMLKKILRKQTEC